MIGLIFPTRRKVELDPDRDSNRDMHFKGQQIGEEVICFCRKHWLTALSHFGLWALLVVIESIFIFNFGKIYGIVEGNFGIAILYFGVVVLLTIYVHKTFLRFFSYFLNTVIFTNTRVIVHKKTLFLQDSHEVLDITKIQDVKKLQDGIFKNLLGYGDLMITLSSDKSSLLIPFVPNVNFHFRCLSRIKRDTVVRGKIRSLRKDEERLRGSFPVEKSEEMIKLEREQIEDAYKKIIGETVKSKTEIVRVSEPEPVYGSTSYHDLLIPDESVEKKL